MKRLLIVILALAFLTACASTQPGAAPADSGDSGDELNIDDISEAFTSNIPVKCTVNIEGSMAELWLKGESYRVEASAEGQKAVSIFNGRMMYTWEETSKQGFMMDLDKMKELAEEMGEEPPETGGYTKDDLEALGKDVRCTRTNIPDSMFAKPSGIQFQDMTEMMEQMMTAYS